MPCSIDVRPGDNLVVITLEGTIRGDETVKAMEGIVEVLSDRPGMNRLWDGTDIDSFILEPEDVVRYDRLFNEHRAVLSGGRVAFVAHRPVDQTMARLVMALGRAPAMRTFTSTAAARAWLDGSE